MIYDDIDLPPGKVRVRKSGGPGTHNGMRSIAQHLGDTDFPRLRVGTGNGGFAEGHQVDFVLGELLLEEKRMLPLVLERAVEAIKCYGTEGIDRAMTRFNRAVVTEDQSSPSTPSSEKKEP